MGCHGLTADYRAHAFQPRRAGRIIEPRAACGLHRAMPPTRASDLLIQVINVAYLFELLDAPAKELRRLAQTLD